MCVFEKGEALSTPHSGMISCTLLTTELLIFISSVLPSIQNNIQKKHDFKKEWKII